MEQDKSQLIGSWQLLSAQLEMADTKERFDLLGPSPVGRTIFTRNGRMATILTASGRTAAVDVPSTAALFGSMMAYSGTFRFEEGAKSFSAATQLGILRGPEPSRFASMSSTETG